MRKLLIKIFKSLLAVLFGWTSTVACYTLFSTFVWQHAFDHNAMFLFSGVFLFIWYVCAILPVILFVDEQSNWMVTLRLAMVFFGAMAVFGYILLIFPYAYFFTPWGFDPDIYYHISYLAYALITGVFTGIAYVFLTGTRKS